MLDYETHSQAAPSLATYLSSSGATVETDNILQETVKESTEDISLFRKAHDREEKWMSRSNTASYNITSDQALLCPARVRGYSFVDKTWAFFMVDKVQEIKWQPQAFNKLELDDKMKATILAMVSVHQDQDDFDVGHVRLTCHSSSLTCIGHHSWKGQRPRISTLW